MGRLIPLKDKKCDKCGKRHTTVLLGVPVMYCFKECQRHEAPEVDAVPVVRCKDCKWYEISELNRDGTDDKRHKPSVCVISTYAKPRPAEWYCADGERREDGANR